MGLALPVIELILELHAQSGFDGPLLMLGVQDVGAGRDEIAARMRAHGLKEASGRLLADARSEPGTPEVSRPVSDRELFAALGISDYDALDLFDGEGATIVHDLCEPVPEELRGHFGLVLDGGTLEHVFDVAAALRNVVALVRPGGDVLHVTPVSGWEDHGFFELQPKLLQGILRANGFSRPSLSLVHLPRDDASRPARIERNFVPAADFPTDSRRERTLLVLRARKERRVEPFVPPVDTHQESAQAWVSLPSVVPAATRPRRRRSWHHRIRRELSRALLGKSGRSHGPSPDGSTSTLRKRG